ncbi:uncharacterized protein LOC124885309 [Capsicum annuum]|uniref:uncharacterized protein LOC124885309 n=1 Tax=Capsicum annuum TaxID=4072 RepID=UPI001FB0E653|nr:uncharacterized protein LOC124885309 [Capsicum annuum]
MAVTRNSAADPSTTTAAPGNTPTSAGTIEIDHNHPLNLHPNDTPVHDQWERVNAVVLSWIMNSIRKDLLSSIIHASDAHNVWIDLKERFDKVNGSRVFYLHREIVTLSQGTLSVADYFSRMRTLWDEFDAFMPSPRCSYPESRSYAQRVLQFLMGLNETYSQCRSQILLMTPVPSISKVYSMIVDHESQRSIASSSSVGRLSDTLDAAALFNYKLGYKGKGGYLGPGDSGGTSLVKTTSIYEGRPPASTYKGAPQKKTPVVCEFCGYNGHTKDQCFKPNRINDPCTIH